MERVVYVRRSSWTTRSVHSSTKIDADDYTVHVWMTLLDLDNRRDDSTPPQNVYPPPPFASSRWISFLPLRTRRRARLRRGAGRVFGVGICRSLEIAVVLLLEIGLLLGLGVRLPVHLARGGAA